MPELTLPTAIAAGLPWFATFLSAFLASDRFKPGVNAVIAAIAILTTATVCTILAGDFTGNAQVSFLAIIGYVMLLMHGDLHLLYHYMASNVTSPIDLLLGPPDPPAPAAGVPKLPTKPLPPTIDAGQTPAPTAQKPPLPTSSVIARPW